MKGLGLVAPLVFLFLVGCGEKPEPVVAPVPAGSAPVESPSVTARAESSKAAPAGPTLPGSTTRATELKDKPFVDAKTLTTLAANTALTVLERQGGWMRVSAAGREGWVRMLNVRTGTGTAPTGSDAKTVTTLATGRAGTGNIVATSGIRGLNEEQLRTAKGDREQLKKMESYRVNRPESAQYAAKHGLKSGKVAYLPDPGDK